MKSKDRTIKAFMCCSGRTIDDGVLLVFAKSKNQARFLAASELGDYISVRAYRDRPYDCYAPDGPKIIHSNRWLPADAPPYYVEGGG